MWPSKCWQRMPSIVTTLRFSRARSFSNFRNPHLLVWENLNFLRQFKLWICSDLPEIALNTKLYLKTLFSNLTIQSLEISTLFTNYGCAQFNTTKVFPYTSNNTCLPKRKLAPKSYKRSCLVHQGSVVLKFWAECFFFPTLLCVFFSELRDGEEDETRHNCWFVPSPLCKLLRFR